MKTQLGVAAAATRGGGERYLSPPVSVPPSNTPAGGRRISRGRLVSLGDEGEATVIVRAVVESIGEQRPLGDSVSTAANGASSDSEAEDGAVEVLQAGASSSSRGVRRNSQQAFAERDHTALLLDWDDTLFPTTWVREDCKLDYRFHLQKQPQLGPGERRDAIEAFLAKHLAKVVEFLAEAAELANVFIVTLAKRGWVDTTIAHFMPGLADAVKQHTRKVIYAQEFADEEEVQQYMNLAGDPDRAEECANFWTRVKGEAIAKELEEFHRRVDASWKNVISLGDSDFERYGTISAGQDYMRREMEGGSIKQTGQTAEGVSKDGHLKRLRLKTVKMLDKPTVLELTAELKLLRSWLPHIVRRDEGLDVEIEGTDDDAELRKLHAQVTHEVVDEGHALYSWLSWRELAGMTEACA